MAYRKPGTPSSSSKLLSTSETREMAMLTGAEIVKSKTPIVESKTPTVESKTPIHSFNLYLNLGKIFKSMHLFLMLSRTNTHKACWQCLSMCIKITDYTQFVIRDVLLLIQIVNKTRPNIKPCGTPFNSEKNTISQTFALGNISQSCSDRRFNRFWRCLVTHPSFSREILRHSLMPQFI